MQVSVTLPISPDHFRKLSDPIDPKRSVYHCYVQIRHLASAISLGPNPRAHEVDSRIGRVIRESLEENVGLFHLLNRGAGRRLLFTKDEDFLAFERVVEETLRTRRMRLCAYCLMPNHWHFVVWPERDGDLAAFMQQVTNTHVKRWKEHRHEIGCGHLYQGRYKCFPGGNRRLLLPGRSLRGEKSKGTGVFLAGRK